MKTKHKIFLIVICMFITSNIQAELKHFLPHTNGVMSVLNRKFWFEGDTIIENTRYTKVYQQHCTSETECDDWEYYAAVREDTIAEKIYCIQTQDGVERLLADFDVQEGDEVTVYDFWFFIRPEEQVVKIGSIDSVLIDNQYRKRINSAEKMRYSDLPYDSWVEGFGSIVYGLFSPYVSRVVDLGDPPRFLCLHIDNVLIYQNPEHETCYLKDHGVNLPKIVPDHFKIYPVWVSDALYVDTAFCPCLYKIYNAQGKRIQSGWVSDNSMDVSLLNPDIYLIEFYSDNGLRLYSGKFIKH